MSAPRTEYPRPHFDRSHSWLPLTGAWAFRRDAQRAFTAPGDVDGWPEQITVPFAWETDASGISAHWLTCGWYRRHMQAPRAWNGQRIVLHVGAAHHETTVWVNDRLIGSHIGGYVPFEFDITDALEDLAATIVIRVEAPVDKRFIPHGKQRSIPRDDYDGCSFTPSSGIWQPIWLEARPATHVTGVALQPSAALDGFTAVINLAGPHINDGTVRIDCDGATPIELPASPQLETTITINDARLWSPQHPHLYPVRVTLTTPDGADLVTASGGLRRVEVTDGTLLLNGERIYLRGVLDQGYWPATGITAPTDEAFVRDIELARDAGYNLIRKHLKLEDPRFAHHADRLGILVWAEPPSTGRWRPDAVASFEAQLPAMLARDGNHPSIIIWGVYNEEWGLDWDVPGDPAKQAAVRRAYQLVKHLDPSRPVVDNSGWAHVETDLVDWHVYDEQPAGWTAKIDRLLSGESSTFPVAIAVDATVDKQLMARGQPPAEAPVLNSEYGGGYTSTERAWNLHWQTQALRRHDSNAGYVWTELYDIEHETAGIYDAHRAAKDWAGRTPSDANADTVAILDVKPIAPGADIITNDSRIETEIRVSHHGPAPLDATIALAWGHPLSAAHDGPASSIASLTVKPFQLSDPVMIAADLPEGATAARLHVLVLADDRIVARSCLDVVRP